MLLGVPLMMMMRRSNGFLGLAVVVGRLARFSVRSFLTRDPI